MTDCLNPSEYNPYYTSYIEKSTDRDIVSGLVHNLETVVSFYESIDKSKHTYSYAVGKWTIKDILLHIIDTERIFTYRALRIARNDNTAMAGFDQDDYVANGRGTERTLEDLIEEFKAVRRATISLFKNFNDKDLVKTGMASGSVISVRAIGYIITGHENHHNQVITERYL